MELLKHRTWGNEGIFDGKWEGNDSQENYFKNRKTFGQSWPWHNNSVTYTYNSHKYRCPEFDTIDWNGYIIMFGCSQTFGIGVSDEHTISSYLTNLGYPTINLGQPSVGADYQFFNSIILKENQIKPKAVIYNWPPPGRVIQWTDYNLKSYNLWGPWNTGKEDWGWNYVSDISHSTSQVFWYSRAVNLLWDCPIIEVTRNKELCNDSNIKLLPPYVDHARDWNGQTGHAGPKTNLKSAQLLADILFKKCL